MADNNILLRITPTPTTPKPTIKEVVLPEAKPNYALLGKMSDTKNAVSSNMEAGLITPTPTVANIPTIKYIPPNENSNGFVYTESFIEGFGQDNTGTVVDTYSIQYTFPSHDFSSEQIVNNSLYPYEKSITVKSSAKYSLSLITGMDPLTSTSFTANKIHFCGSTGSNTHFFESVNMDTVVGEMIIEYGETNNKAYMCFILVSSGGDTANSTDKLIDSVYKNSKSNISSITLENDIELSDWMVYYIDESSSKVFVSPKTINVNNTSKGHLSETNKYAVSNLMTITSNNWYQINHIYKKNDRSPPPDESNDIYIDCAPTGTDGSESQVEVRQIPLDGSPQQSNYQAQSMLISFLSFGLVVVATYIFFPKLYKFFIIDVVLKAFSDAKQQRIHFYSYGIICFVLLFAIGLYFSGNGLLVNNNMTNAGIGIFIIIYTILLAIFFIRNIILPLDDEFEDKFLECQSKTLIRQIEDNDEFTKIFTGIFTGFISGFLGIFFPVNKDYEHAIQVNKGSRNLSVIILIVAAIFAITIGTLSSFYNINASFITFLFFILLRILVTSVRYWGIMKEEPVDFLTKFFEPMIKIIQGFA
jgi:hypothetical protein